MKAHYIAICSKTSLPKIREFVRDQLSAYDVQPLVSDQLVLAMDEACANSIIHQHKCDEKDNIELVIYRRGNEIHFELRDVGMPFNILQYKPEDLENAILERKKGGLGILLITKIMDKVELIEGDKRFTYHFVKYIS
jgi:serine/threonine-protein kinase RsbW